MDVELEAEVRRCCTSRDWARGTTLAVEGYGPQVLGYLVARTRDEAEAHDVFARWSEDIWRGLASFRWESSLRTWGYRLAHNARVRHQQRDRMRNYVPLSGAPEILAMVAQVRTATAQHLRTEVKDAISKLRDALAEDDRSLLILRVDRGLSWAEIAAVHDDPDRAATYRKRFERAKARLAALAADAGLL